MWIHFPPSNPRMLWAADETALDLFARRTARGFFTGWRWLDAPVSSAHAHGTRRAERDGYQPRHVVEVSGDAATPLALTLLHVIAAFLMRPHEPSTESNDKVIVFDHECELSARALLQIVSDKLQSTMDDPDKRKAHARRLLERVAVFHCRDSFQWLATINKLHFDLLAAPPGPSLIVIHSVASFHAIDTMVAKRVGQGLALADHVFLILKQFIRQHSPIVFASKPTPTNARGGWDSPEYLPSSWSSQVSKRIQLRVVSRDDNTESQIPSQYEARSFAMGKSRIHSFQVEGLSFVEDSIEPPFLNAESSFHDVEVDVPPSLAIAKADTNAALLWKR